MPTINIDRKSINEFIGAMNHRMTSIEEKTSKIEIDVRWMKRLGYYMAGIVTTIAIKLLFF